MSVTTSVTKWKVWTLTRWLFQPSLSGSTSRTRDRLRRERKPSPCAHRWSLPRVRNPAVHITAWWLFLVGPLGTKLITLCCSSKVSYCSLRLVAALVSPGELRVQPGAGMESGIGWRWRVLLPLSVSHSWTLLKHGAELEGNQAQRTLFSTEEIALGSGVAGTGPPLLLKAPEPTHPAGSSASFLQRQRRGHLLGQVGQGLDQLSRHSQWCQCWRGLRSPVSPLGGEPLPH